METVNKIGLTERLAEAALSLDVPKFLNEETIRYALVDTLSVAMAARQEDGIVRLRSTILPDEQSLTVPWVSTAAVGEADAAFLNGTAAHFLDFDDVSPTMPLHPSAVLVPTLLAVKDIRGLPFEDFVEAFNVGQAMFRTIAQALPSAEHYARGWHSTATVGRLAGVAAIARFRMLDLQTTATAMAIASTMAAGSRANFGTMTKPMHAGMAAKDALLAVRWASVGITANTQELEAPGGYFARFGTNTQIGQEFSEEIEERFEFWLNDWALDWGLKRYPSCYGTHRAIDAALNLRSDFGESLTPSDVEHVEVTVHKHGTAPLQNEPPQTGTQAKFSLEHCVALALFKGHVELADFLDPNFADGTVIKQLSERVNLEETSEVGEFARVVLTRVEEGPAEATVFAAKGDSSNPLSTNEIAQKISSCLAYSNVSEKVLANLLTALNGLPATADVLELVDENIWK